ncbi:MAG: 4'-phosphopantetheinyl transferase superfamily protein [Holosporaceae bacterium]|jgi:4'-phosphopantetheinyl transferase|nr:4'-phosphopantetheinyl transferase superfamily protein [Holosporaceae bacterium]
MNWSQLLQKRSNRQIINDVLLYKIDLHEISSEEYDFLLPFLNEEEKDRASRMIKPVSERFVLCRAACKKILSKQLSVSHEQIRFIREKNGKPYLKNEKNLHFSISHSKDMAVLGIYHAPIGIDVEFIDEKCDMLSLMDFFMNEQEKEWVLSKNTGNRFFTVWTLKESILKKTGLGISDKGFPSLETEEDNSFGHGDDVLYSFPVNDGKYILSICV